MNIVGYQEVTAFLLISNKQIIFCTLESRNYLLFIMSHTYDETRKHIKPVTERRRAVVLTNELVDRVASGSLFAHLQWKWTYFCLFVGCVFDGMNTNTGSVTPTVWRDTVIKPVNFPTCLQSLCAKLFHLSDLLSCNRSVYAVILCKCLYL